MNNEQTLSQGGFISKKESVMLQGFAVLLMVWHHLFGFSERVSVPYILVFDSLFHIETIVAYFGRICIAVFAFCSGYGMEKKSISSKNTGFKGLPLNYRNAVSHLAKFYTKFWMIFIVFVPIGFLLNKYLIHPETIVKSFLGYSYAYNAEWWYIGHYVKLMLLFPLLSALGEWLERKNVAFLYISMVFCAMGMALIPKQASCYSFCSILICFVEGMYFARTVWFEKGALRLKNNWHHLLIGAVLIAAVFALRTLGVADHWTVSLLVFGFVLLIKNQIVRKYAGTVFYTIGKYSTYIWLTHTFFAYYYFQPLTYAPKYSWLIAIWCILLCVFSGIVLERIRRLFCVGTKHKSKKANENNEVIR